MKASEFITEIKKLIYKFNEENDVVVSDINIKSRDISTNDRKEFDHQITITFTE